MRLMVSCTGWYEVNGVMNSLDTGLYLRHMSVNVRS